MNHLNNKIIVIDGSRVASMAVVDDCVYVTKLPACSVGTYLMILGWLQDLGYAAK